jgi:hypothetical protein
LLVLVVDEVAVALGVSSVYCEIEESGEVAGEPVELPWPVADGIDSTYWETPDASAGFGGDEARAGATATLTDTTAAAVHANFLDAPEIVLIAALAIPRLYSCSSRTVGSGHSSKACP